MFWCLFVLRGGEVGGILFGILFLFGENASKSFFKLDIPGSTSKNNQSFLVGSKNKK